MLIALMVPLHLCASFFLSPSPFVSLFKFVFFLFSRSPSFILYAQCSYADKADIGSKMNIKCRCVVLLMTFESIFCCSLFRFSWKSASALSIAILKLTIKKCEKKNRLYIRQKVHNRYCCDAKRYTNSITLPVCLVTHKCHSNKSPFH